MRHSIFTIFSFFIGILLFSVTANAQDNTAVLEKLVAWDLQKIERDVKVQWLELIKEKAADPTASPGKIDFLEK